MVELHDVSGQLVARSLLPYEFVVKANGNGNSNGRPRPYKSARQRTKQPRLDPSSASALELRSPELPGRSYLGSADDLSQHNTNSIAPVLRKLSPVEGPVSGGPIIMISGINFPPPDQQIIYARFGNVVVPTVRLVLLSQLKTDSIHRPGKTHLRSSASYPLL